MPAEWEKHSATQLHWPSNPETWPGKRLEKVEQVYLDIIEALHLHEPIHLLVNDEKTKKRALDLLKERAINLQDLTVHVQPVNDIWARDCGPIFVRRKNGHKEEFAITDWDYNAWGGKYPPFDADNRLPEYFASKYNMPRFETGMILEGGSIETNGDGVLLTTESVLLNPNRNPNLSKDEIEQRLKDYLGIEKIIWLKQGLEGDDTDGHIDDLARFLNKNTILAMVSEDPADMNYERLRVNLEILQKATNQQGEPFIIKTLPLPKTKIEGTTVDGSEYVPASYANFYIANGLVLVPLYDERYDQKALDRFDEYFPDREVV
ncbi:MAG TPA: agmatine deiminase family protein, partial [Balneolaceae bacterium]|nr:agmatine deiminase family protein [Balneolaceae bacterium]